MSWALGTNISQEAERLREEEDARERNIALGNPLLNKQDFNMKRRWDDDVVFKNQARGTEDKNKKKEFVNVSFHLFILNISLHDLNYTLCWAFANLNPRISSAPISIDDSWASSLDSLLIRNHF